MLRATALLALALAALPAALAQAPAPFPCALSLTPTGVPDPIPVATGLGLASLQVDYAVLAPGGAAQKDGVDVDLTVVALPAWALATPTPATVHLTIPPSPESTWSATPGKGTIAITTLPTAPAFVPGEVRVHASSRATPLVPACEAEATFVAMAAWNGDFVLRPLSSVLQIAPGGAAVARVQVESLANGNSVVSFDVANAIAGLSARADPVALESRATGGTATAALATLSLVAGPGFAGGDLTIRARSSYALDPALAGPEHTLTFHVEPVGGAGLVQAQAAGVGGGSGALPMIGAIALALVAALLVGRFVARRK